MGDFVETNNQKTATRELAAPIADISTFETLIQSVLDDNPFGCTDYTEDGAVVDGIARNRESYTVKVNYETTEGKKIGTLTIRAPTVAAFTAGAADVMGNTDLGTALGGSPVRDAAHEAFSCRLKCHDPAGELYFVTFTRNRVTITSYGEDSIRAAVEAWADTVPALG
ncbi:MAG: hypothetical protein APR53_00925 [Methanoculleus sp. SDB]|nr:MAG: hypothetical protein APR53_00925 [Methanoculleus sp. SDB]